jgi:dimethylglycine dehydrogenase
MKSHARVVVIGGGVVGCSVLYHLAKMGWTDVVLLERSELTSGSTWHAAGGMHTLNGDTNVAKLQQYTIDLYREIEEISGQSCGLHVTGGVLLAGTDERMDFLRQMRAKDRYMGLESELISVEEAAELFPLMDTSYFKGALYEQHAGHVDPSGVTNAYAKAARIKGAEIHRHTMVKDMHQTPDGTWHIVTDNGNIAAEHVVNAGGLWARELGRMVGLELPVLAMEHMYLLTEEMPEVAEYNERTGKEVIHATDFEGEIYMRQERGGMLMGTYERAGKPWSPQTTPWDFDTELLPPDLDRIAPSLEVGFAHFPAFERAGIKQIINGPFTFAPDGNPLVGPIRGMTNYWSACAVMAGFSQGGGVGLALANWMIHGDPGFDIWGMDVARFGDWARPAYTNAKVRENYSRRFSITYPNEELPAGRPLRTTPIHDRLQARNAVFGAGYGLEHALYFAPAGEAPQETPTFRRSNAFGPVGEECRAVRNGVGMIETSNFAKYEITGPNAEKWLDGLLTNKVPRAGRMTLSPMLKADGGLIGDFTLAKLAEDRFLIVGAGGAEDYHMRWFLQHKPDGVEVVAHGQQWTGLSLAGPKAREVLQAVTASDVSPEAFKFLDIRHMDIGMVPALVGRITFTGELGYEIYTTPDFQTALFDTLMAAGEPYGIRLFGGRALNSLRLEKGFGAWASEYRPIYGPEEAGMSRFVKLDKGEFIGREGAEKERRDGPKRRLVTLAVDAANADASGDEPIWHGETVVGWVTSGGYGHTVAQSIALGYIDAGIVDAGHTENFAVEILGERRPARRLTEALVDPSGARMRS